jgi:hypothetical protein
LNVHNCNGIKEQFNAMIWVCSVVVYFQPVVTFPKIILTSCRALKQFNKSVSTGCDLTI